MNRETKTRSEKSDEPARDGRAARSERSRDAIANALFELVGEGELEPTAQQVSERAGVGIRSVFRHFEHMEALYATLDSRVLSEILPILRQQPPSSGLRERAKALVKRRAVLFEKVAPYKRASLLKRRRSPFLRDRHGRDVAEFRADLLRWIPELEKAAPETLEALDLATSFEAWDRLRSEQRLGHARAAAAMERAALALVDDLAG